MYKILNHVRCFIINTVEIQENFIKIFGGEKYDLQSFSVSSGINITGIDCINNSSISIPLSLSTTVTVRKTNDGFYKFIDLDSDVMYQCSSNNLLDYNDNKNIKNIFRAIAFFKGNLNGAEILFNYSTDDPRFKQPIHAVSVALGIMGNNSIPSVNEIDSLTKNEHLQNKNTACSLFGRRDTAIYCTSNNKAEYLPFNISDYKLVIAALDVKKENIKTSDIQRKIDNNALKSDVSEIASFFIKEPDRINKVYNNLFTYKTVNEEFADIMREYAKEFSHVFGNYGKILYKAHSIAEDTSLTSAVIPSYDYKGICAVVKNNNVDRFIESFSNTYMQIMGSKTFYFICNTADSGIELNSTVPIMKP